MVYSSLLNFRFVIVLISNRNTRQNDSTAANPDIVADNNRCRCFPHPAGHPFFVFIIPQSPALAQEPGFVFFWVFARQPRFCEAIGFYSAGGVHRSLLPPEEPPPEELLPPSSGAGGTTSGVWRRVVEAA